MEMVNVQTILKEMILLLGIIGSVGIQNTENNQTYKLDIWSKATATVPSATRNYQVHFFLTVDVNTITDMTKLKSYLIQKGVQATSPYGTDSVMLSSCLEIRSGWYYDKNSHLIQPLSIGITKKTYPTGYDWGAPTIRRLNYDGNNTAIEEYPLTSYPETNSGWHFDYV